jgi:aspartate kinase
VKADLYENWTDVSGLCSADPRIVNKPKRIGSVSHRELRELSYMGANVFHEEALFPLRGTKIPIKIKNTNRPKNPGTLIEEMPSILWDTNKHKNAGSIVGIAGRKGFISITIEKSMMNQEVGFTARVLRIFGDEKISIEHAPSGIDTMSVIVHESHFKNDQNRLHAIADLIKAHVDADRVTVKHKMAMICIVGQSMAHTPGVSARIFSALGRAKINIQMINQGSSEISIIVGVANEDSDTAIRAIYKTFRKRHMRPSRITQKA